MRELTDAEIAQQRALRAQIIKHNGHIAYQIFTDTQLAKEIRIDGISAPFDAIPIFVAFTNPALVGTHSANDVDNKTGGKSEESVFDKVTSLMKEVEKPVEIPKKRPTFTVVE